jgi:hypothetical protein
MRVQLFGRSVDEVINFIQQRVDAKAEKVQDAQIQKIYASESEIRKIYSPRKGGRSTR